MCLNESGLEKLNCDEMFLGGSLVHAEGSKRLLIACAPRWGRLFSKGHRVERATVGACYVMDQTHGDFQLPGVANLSENSALLSPFKDGNVNESNSIISKSLFCIEFNVPILCSVLLRTIRFLFILGRFQQSAYIRSCRHSSLQQVLL